MRDLPPLPGGPFLGANNPWPSPDGRTVYFQTSAPGGVGKSDLWEVRRVPKAAPP